MTKVEATPEQSKTLKILLAAGLSMSAAISGVFLVIPSEGLVNATYLDPVGIITACYGHTDPYLKMGTTYTHTECLNYLAKDLSKAEVAVNRQVPVPLNTYQKAALISFTYNVGEGRLKSSTMRKLFNQRDYKGGCDQLVYWVYSKKKKLKGLETRRNLEMSMCLGQMELSDANSNESGVGCSGPSCTSTGWAAVCCSSPEHQTRRECPAAKGFESEGGRG